MVYRFLNKIYLTIFASFLILTLSQFAKSQDKWELVSYQNWTKNEVKAILSNSPWSKKVEANVNWTPDRVGHQALQMEERAVILLRSALPVRQALLRQRQLDSKYDKMNEKQKQVFDAANLPLLECSSCKDYYAVSVLYSYQDIEGSGAADEIKKLVYLSNEKDERRYLSNVVNNGGEIVFLFPRLNEKGEPLITEKNQKLIFNTQLNSSSYGLPSLFSKVDFDVAKIVRNGKIVF